MIGSKTPCLPRFYPIVDHPDWLDRLLPLGIGMVQLRMKDVSVATLRRAIARSLKVCRSFGTVLVVNDFWQLAIEEGAQWVHLGQEDLVEADTVALKKAGVKLGVSTHTEEELAHALSFSPDYIALGPIFETILKPMRYPPQGIARIGEWKRRVGAVPLVAIGGLTPERGRQALDAGAQSVCVVTDVLRHKDPEARVQEWLAL